MNCDSTLPRAERRRFDLILTLLLQIFTRPPSASGPPRALSSFYATAGEILSCSPPKTCPERELRPTDCLSLVRGVPAKKARLGKFQAWRDRGLKTGRRNWSRQRTKRRTPPRAANPKPISTTLEAASGTLVPVTAHIQGPVLNQLSPQRHRGTERTNLFSPSPCLSASVVRTLCSSWFPFQTGSQAAAPSESTLPRPAQF